jgi:uncharacterized surface protein with fasciclin (FAS1) repeats
MKNKSILKKIAVVFSLAALIISCDPYEGTLTPAYDGLPIASLLEADSAKQYSLWIDLLRHANLYNAMNLSDNYTAFVPTNDAMNGFLQKNGISKVTDIPVEEAKYLVRYHTIRGKVIQQSLFENGLIADTTATGDQLTIEIRSGGLSAIYVNGEARIVKLDVKATNGIIHTLESVLTPVTETVWQKMEKPGFSIMKEALLRTGFNTTLNTIFVSEWNPKLNQNTLKKRSFTFFAVPDAVFAGNGINNIDGLLVFLGEGNTDYSSAGNKLYQYVAYHTLDIQLDMAALSTFPGGESSKNIQTMAANQLLNVSLVSESIRINSNVSITKNNIATKNGVVHEVNNVMPVTTPPQTNVIWELTDYADVAALLSSVYRKVGSSTVTTSILPGEVQSYTWEAIPSDRNNRAVRYLVRGTSDNMYEQLVNNDCLVLDLGLYGWVEMNTPTIIAGTYNMSVVYHSRPGTSPTGKFITIFDGNTIGSEIATHGASAIKAEMKSTYLGRVVFTETTTHKLRLLAADTTPLYIDYIKFERVN